MKSIFKILVLFVCIFVSSCSMTKFVPDGSYLLDNVDLEDDNKKIGVADLSNYIQQTPNKSAIIYGRNRLRFYSLSGRDSSKWINKAIRKIGESPVIYSPKLKNLTEKQLKQRLENLGYLNCQVTSQVTTKGKKACVKYIIKTGEQYHIRNFSVMLTDSSIIKIIENPKAKRYLNIKSGQPYVAENLNNASEQITQFLRNQGFFNLNKENFYFLVDTAIGANLVDVEFHSRKIEEDSTDYNPAFTRYRFGDISCKSGLNTISRKSSFAVRERDTIHHKGIAFIYAKEKHYIRHKVLYSNIFIKPQRFYSDNLIEKTYSSLNSLSAVKQSEIRTKARKDTTIVDATIRITPANIYFLQYEIDGTNSAGNLGLSNQLSFQDKNIFNGSETFKIKLKGAFESISGKENYGITSDIYYEYGGEISLSIPRLLFPNLPWTNLQQVGASTIMSVELNRRNRPEYTRNILSLDYKYKWSALRNRLNHQLDVYNINYASTPWKSEWFENYINRDGNDVLRESYKDQFITRSSYLVNFRKFTSKRAQREGYTLQGIFEMAGTLPSIIDRIANRKKEDGHYNIVGVPFAQYAKTTFDYTQLFPIDYKNVTALHIGLGIAYPFGNSVIMPYEQRFFAGGPNSVRGWSTRTLGPGKYQSKGSSDFVNQTGDIKILLNAEHRIISGGLFEYAFFADAGNIWTIDNYENQNGGQFNLKNFVEELAFAGGFGIRPNLGFLLIRLDFGLKLYDPTFSSDIKDRWVITHPNLSRDAAIHFAIGYPF